MVAPLISKMKYNEVSVAIQLATYMRLTTKPNIDVVETVKRAIPYARALLAELDVIREAAGKSPFRTGNRDVAAAGTAVRLTDESITVPKDKRITVLSKPGNSGMIYFGNSKDECESSTKRFDGLSAGLAHSFEVNDVRDIWVDAEIDNDGVSWYVEQ